MSELDLSDRRVREMADRNHQPQEMWSFAGSLLAVSCETCGHGWPCETRRALAALAGHASEARPI